MPHLRINHPRGYMELEGARERRSDTEDTLRKIDSSLETVNIW